MGPPPSPILNVAGIELYTVYGTEVANAVTGRNTARSFRFIAS